MFLRTVAVFTFTPLASSFATAKTPASATALLLAFTFFIGFTTVAAAQSLIGAANRPSSEWSPSKTAGEREVAEGHVPEDNAPPAGPGGKKHRRANSIPLSPAGGAFGPTVRVQEESTAN
ncbi:hypothetical protein M408DRAFT_325669 [Serendipita vermifera MAFF 305830]|uniref:Uncharacterized protein n=1 Tax=Serendipita vermifera MAFF 305830 TaxID=933852 RepID=A0A0C2XZB5_SERVB|nr:hypothetical protein M408DRAFT_325669 [Serendipita vermifera MAFF 305830]